MTYNRRSPYAILINGPSSSGKTTLAQALQDALPDMFLHLGIDKAISLMPLKYRWGGREELAGYAWKAPEVVEGHTHVGLHVGPYGREIEKVLKTMAVASLQGGHNIILDVVEIDDPTLSEWRTVLAGFQTLYVGVRCSVEELERREVARGDRMVGTARAQHRAVHQGAQYDVIVDSTSMSTEEMIKEIMHCIRSADADQHKAL